MPTGASRLSVFLVVVTLLGTGVPHLLAGIVSANEALDHLVISEIVTGGTSASDELIELYNPTAGSLPLEGLELVYASASGLTVSRRTAWELGAPELPPGGHLLVAHELGVYAAIADATYASGMAATGGSVALRIVGAASAIDAVGWGTATSTWREGSVAPAPPAGSSIERLPGGALGSTQDTDDNAADFAVRAVPGPENSASPRVPEPSASDSPYPSATPTEAPTEAPTAPPTEAPSVTPSPSSAATPSAPPSAQPTTAPTPSPAVVPIATARALSDGTEVTIEGVALTGSDFVDGGGYVTDESGGLAVLLSDGSFARGDRLRVNGVIDDRYAQRTLRADGTAVVVLGTAADPVPIEIATGEVGEGVEGGLIRIAGTILAAPTVLSSGLAFDVDDGSGPVRLLVGSATGIDVGGWEAGFFVDALGVAGQRDSSGTGLSGYRVQPRDTADIRSVDPGPSPTPTASPGATSTPEATPEPSQAEDVMSVAAARQLSKGASALVRGVVTLAPGLVDPTTAVLQDATGAIVLRLGDEAGPVARGTRVELRGVRSTLSGMETLRVSTPPIPLGGATEPEPDPVRTGEAGEAHEATLVVVRGGLVANPRRSSAGTVTFEIDDGSGPLRVSIGSSAGVDVGTLATGAWIEVRGVLGQETTGSLPLRGYRVWPRDASDLRVLAPVNAGAASGGSSTAGGGMDPIEGTLTRLDDIGDEAVAGLPIGATLVVGPWEELGLGGLLWDGARLVAIHRDAGALVAGILASGRPPVALRATGLRVIGADQVTGIPVASVTDAPGALVPSGKTPSPPLSALGLEGEDARWVTVVGRLDPRPEASALLVEGASLAIDRRCEDEPMPGPATASVTGILVGEPQRLVVPCGGIVPAPLLARAATTRQAPEIPGWASAVIDRGDESPSGTLPAVLLLLAATTLAAGAGAARWAAGSGPPEPDPVAVDSGAPDEAMSPPTLTLVSLPRERAP